MNTFVYNNDTLFKIDFNFSLEGNHSFLAEHTSILKKQHEKEISLSCNAY